jgi:hypothetical protein
MVHRTPRECEIRWVGDQHPRINHDAWKEQEVTELKSLVSLYGQSQVNWVEVAEKLGVGFDLPKLFQDI